MGKHTRRGTAASETRGDRPVAVGVVRAEPLDPGLRLTASLGEVTAWLCPPPGYLVGQVLGIGRRTVVWSAIRRSSGEPVVLERIRPARASIPERRPSSVLERAQVLASWVALDSPDVVRVHPAVVLPAERTGAEADELVLVASAATYRLVDLLRRRRGRRLPRRQALAVSLAVSRALVAVHEAGLVHGRVGLESVLVHEGRPMLGPPRFDEAAAREVSLAGDVVGLARLVERLLSGRRLTPLLARTLADCRDPATGTDAAAVVAALAGAGRRGRLPLRLAGGAKASARVDGRGGGARRPPVRLGAGGMLGMRRRRMMLGAALGLAVGLIGLARDLGSVASQPALARGSGTASTGPAGRLPSTAWSAVPSAVPTPVTSDVPSAVHSSLAAPLPLMPLTPTPRDATATSDGDVVRERVTDSASAAAVLADLDERRAYAFALDDETALRSLYVAGSGALQQDLASLADLRSRGLSAVGLRLPVATVEVLAAGARTVRLRVTDSRDAYRLVDKEGRTVARVEGRGPRTWLVELQRTDAESAANGRAGEGSPAAGADAVAGGAGSQAAEVTAPLWRYASISAA